MKSLGNDDNNEERRHSASERLQLGREGTGRRGVGSLSHKQFVSSTSPRFRTVLKRVRANNQQHCREMRRPSLVIGGRRFRIMADAKRLCVGAMRIDGGWIGNAVEQSTDDDETEQPGSAGRPCPTPFRHLNLCYLTRPPGKRFDRGRT